MATLDDRNLYQRISSINFSLNLFAKLLFIFTFIIMLLINLVNSKNPILDQHGFRQTQTAISSYYIQKDGFKLNYETPVIGEAWSVPFEFPIYQGIVAATALILPLPLTQIGRLWGLIFTLLTCLPIFFLLKRLKVNERAIYLSLALFLSSPIYLFWSGTFMIEGAALLFSCTFLYYSSLIIEREWTNKIFFLFSIFLLAALLQKITTALPILILILILIIFFTIRPIDFSTNRNNLIKLFLAIFMPLIFAYFWVKYSDLIKMGNPIGSELTSEKLSLWNYGPFDQRFSNELWVNVIFKRNIANSSLYILGLSSILYSLYSLRVGNTKSIIFISCILFLAPFLIFTNLHIVHNYYQTANSIFFSIAFGISATYILNKFFNNRKFLYSIIISIAIISNYYYFYTNYYSYKTTLLTVENNRTLEISNYIKLNTPPNLPIIIYGYDWSSEVGFYSERKSLTLPWGRWDIEAIQNPDHFLTDRPSVYVVCPVSNANLLEAAIRKKYPNLPVQEVAGCHVFPMGRFINGVWSHDYFEGNPSEKYPISIGKFSMTGGDMSISNRGLSVTSNSNDPSVNLLDPLSCPPSSMLILEIDLTRETDGFLQLFYDSKKSFTEKNSIRQYFPSGRINLSFAVRPLDNQTYVRFDPMEVKGVSEIHEIKSYCLP